MFGHDFILVTNFRCVARFLGAKSARMAHLVPALRGEPRMIIGGREFQLSKGESPFFYGSPLPPGAIDQPIKVMIGNSEVKVKG